ncbi:hypothetical protein AURDEDRAFT_65124, partial [Auricularia subglabra TFB-10046 SS5]
SLKSRNLSRGTRDFLWKGLHDTHKISRYFSKMPQPWKDYEHCQMCGCVELMEHILFECPDSGQARAWALVHAFLARKRVAVEIDLGTIWGCVAIQLSGIWDDTTSRAFRIIISESAFLIWKIRCKKRIKHADTPEWHLSDDEVEERWVRVMRGRRAQDMVLTNKRVFKKRALAESLANRTWEDHLDNRNLGTGRDWNKPGVLVGIGLQDAGIG